MKMTEEKLKYLLFLYQLNTKEESVTSAARKLGVAKSTVSRILSMFNKQGLVRQTGKLDLTCEGCKLAKQWIEEIEGLTEWICREAQIPETQAENEALMMALYLTDDTKQKLVARNYMKKFYENIRNVNQITGDLLCANLKEREYYFAFTLYKIDSKDENHISMANSGFYHPGILRIVNGRGWIRLRAKEVENPSAYGKITLSGKLDSLQYKKAGRYVQALQEQDIFCFPIDDMIFYYNHSERFLQSSLRLKLKSDVGNMHMPEREALFTMIFR